MTYRIELTDMARHFATRHSSVKELEELVRQEIETYSKPGARLSFSIVSSPGGQDYICTPSSDDVVRVNTCSREEGPVVERGPLKGQLLWIPSADSEGRGEDE
jgi:hypothetical protein